MPFLFCTSEKSVTTDCFRSLDWQWRGRTPHWNVQSHFEPAAQLAHARCRRSSVSLDTLLVLPLGRHLSCHPQAPPCQCLELAVMFAVSLACQPYHVLCHGHHMMRTVSYPVALLGTVHWHPVAKQEKSLNTRCLAVHGCSSIHSGTACSWQDKQRHSPDVDGHPKYQGSGAVLRRRMEAVDQNTVQDGCFCIHLLRGHNAAQ
jgi:hypothetical protein